MQTKRSPEDGFNLIELMVVLAIIGVLAALLLPALSSAKAKGNSASCQSHLRQMGLALKMYVDEHGNAYPYYLGPADSWDEVAASAANRSFWWSKLYPYYPVKWANRSYHCPGYRGMVSEHSENGPLGSYGYNTYGVAIPGGGYSDPSRGIKIKFPVVRYGLGRTLYRTPGLPKLPVTSEDQVRSPSRMLAIGESRFLSAQANRNAGGQDVMVCGLVPGGSDLYPFDPARHGRDYNLVFCDGHVEQMNPRVLFDPRESAPMWNYDNQPHSEFWIPN